MFTVEFIKFVLIASPLVWGVKYCMSVCTSARSSISKTTWPSFTKFSVYVISNRVSVLFW